MRIRNEPACRRALSEFFSDVPSRLSPRWPISLPKEVCRFVSMISLRKAIDDSDAEHRLCEELKVSYLSALEAMAECPVPVSDDLVASHQKQLYNLRTRLARTMSDEILPQVREQVAEELKAYSTRSGEILKRRAKEIKRILQYLSEAASAVVSQGQSQSGRLIEFTRSLESITQIDDLPEIRRRLGREVLELRQIAVQVRSRAEETVENLQNEVRMFQQKLAETEEIALTDSLTQVPNRRAGERKIDELIAMGKTFSVFLFDLDRFKTINDRWGHQAGDAVLAEFARRLVEAVAREDTVCRWGGDEFLVIVPTQTRELAERRASQLTELCTGQYRLRPNGETIAITVQAAMGFSHRRKGESADSLFRRADEQLYQTKGRKLKLG